MFTKNADSSGNSTGRVAGSIASTGASRPLPKLSSLNLISVEKNKFNDDIKEAIKTPVGSEDRSILVQRLTTYQKNMRVAIDR